MLILRDFLFYTLKCIQIRSFGLSKDNRLRYEPHT